MHYAKLERPAGRENLKHWIVNVLLLVGCFGTFLILGGCKPPATQSKGVVIEDNKEKVAEYMNNRTVNEVTPPEIMDPSTPPDTLNDEPPVTPQVGGSF